MSKLLACLERLGLIHSTVPAAPVEPNAWRSPSEVWRCGARSERRPQAAGTASLGGGPCRPSDTQPLPVIAGYPTDSVKPPSSVATKKMAPVNMTPVGKAPEHVRAVNSVSSFAISSTSLPTPLFDATRLKLPVQVAATVPSDVTHSTSQPGFPSLWR
jgi:hypothetical protein